MIAEDKLKTDLASLQRAYALVFGRASDERDTAVAIVLRDLATEGFAHHSTFDPDPRVHARNEGRRDIWLRIQELRNISTDELWGRLRKQFNYVPPPVDDDEDYA